MKKYLLLAIYLLTMIAIYQLPIPLPNDGRPLPLQVNDKRTPPKEPMDFALESMSSKSAFFELTFETEKVGSSPFLTDKMK
jgi:hypothetical protein